jgi:hypothetical protein
MGRRWDSGIGHEGLGAALLSQGEFTYGFHVTSMDEMEKRVGCILRSSIEFIR